MSKKVTLPFDFEFVKVAKHLGREATKYSSDRRCFLRICAADATPNATFAIIAAKTVKTTARSWYYIARTFIYIADPKDLSVLYLMVVDPGITVHRVEVLTHEEYESRRGGMEVFTTPLKEIELGIKHGVD